MPPSFYKKKKKSSSSVPLTNEKLLEEFLIESSNCRNKNPGQEKVLNAVFDEKNQYVFYRAGRKGSKTTTAIESAWRFALSLPKSVGYLCYPTISQGIEVVWEERRLQTYDCKEDTFFEKYIEKTDDSKHILWFKNGSFIKIIGTWTEKKGRGTQPDYLIYDEFQDCNPDFVEAMDSNLAAKNSQCIFMGTPPKKRNHYEDWWERVETNPRGKAFHFTSYDNVSLPHLREWLDNKKTELLKASKEDVWLREYMAEFCYSSSDRVLPDAIFTPEIYKNISNLPYAERIPVVAISVLPQYFCAIFGILQKGRNIFIVDHVIFKQVWNQSFSDMYPKLNDKIKTLQEQCGKKVRNIVWDESGSFIEIIQGFTKCRKDIKWQERGIPLLREMMAKNKITFSNEVADLALECQNLLVEENEKEVQKNYPLVCTTSMLINEFFSQEKVSFTKHHEFDKWQAFRDMGIPCPNPKNKNRFFTIR